MSSLIGGVVSNRVISYSGNALSLWGISSWKLGSLHSKKLPKEDPTPFGVGSSNSSCRSCHRACRAV
jgi:hypothetical protein